MGEYWHATAATRVIVATTLAMVIVSVGWTPKSNEAIRRFSPDRASESNHETDRGQHETLPHDLAHDA